MSLTVNFRDRCEYILFDASGRLFLLECYLTWKFLWVINVHMSICHCSLSLYYLWLAVCGGRRVAWLRVLLAGQSLEDFFLAHCDKPQQENAGVKKQHLAQMQIKSWLHWRHGC